MRIDRDDGGDPAFLPKRLMERCEDDLELADEVLQDYQLSAPRGLARLAAAMGASDPVQVRMEAHSLKGSSRAIGAEALAVVCARLEAASAGGDLSDAPALFEEAERRWHIVTGILSAYLNDRARTVAGYGITG